MQLKEMTNVIQRMIQDEFLRLSIGRGKEDEQENQFLLTLSRERTQERLEEKGKRPQMGQELYFVHHFHELGLDERLSPLLFGLLRLGKIRQTIQTYRERMQKKVNKIIDKVLQAFSYHSKPSLPTYVLKISFIAKASLRFELIDI